MGLTIMETEYHKKVLARIDKDFDNMLKNLNTGFNNALSSIDMTVESSGVVVGSTIKAGDPSDVMDFSGNLDKELNDLKSKIDSMIRKSQ